MEQDYIHCWQPLQSASLVRYLHTSCCGLCVAAHFWGICLCWLSFTAPQRILLLVCLVCFCLFSLWPPLLPTTCAGWSSCLFLSSQYWQSSWMSLSTLNILITNFVPMTLSLVPYRPSPDLQAQQFHHLLGTFSLDILQMFGSISQNAPSSIFFNFYLSLFFPLL
jgi:hypothetical protein